MAKKVKTEKEPFKIAVCALIFNKEGKILGVSRKGDTNDIGLPGGKLEKDEEIMDGIKREVYEETGLILSEPSWLMSSDDNCGYFVVAFTGKCEGTPKSMEEGTKVGWFDWEDLEKGSFGWYNSRLRTRYESIQVIKNL